MLHSFTGCIKDRPDLRDFIYEPCHFSSTLPPHFTLPSEHLPAILNQESLRSCVANEISNVLKYCLSKEGYRIFQPSRLFIYFFGRVLHNFPSDADTGLSIRHGIQSVAQYGACDEILWPYDTVKFKIKPNEECINKAKNTIPKFRYVSIPNRIETLKSALYEGYPIVFGMTIYESFIYANTWKTGMVPIPQPNEHDIGGHCVAAYGWIDEIQCFLMMNSWGEGYGMKGWFYLPYEYVLKHGWDFWQVQFFSESVSK